ncbi:MAG: hypothetical protein IJ053_04685 [Lachnospiraceae bacterium]|nr:hypothetical protein [Lachnospiraceae bacterium]
MKKKILLVVVLALTLVCGCLKNSKDDNKFETHEAKTATERVGGLIAYNKNSDLIIDIPEDYFLNIDKDMTYSELIAEIGEPSGTVGSGIVRDYWRIDEDKYAVAYWSYGEDDKNLGFEMWTGESTPYKDSKTGE